MKLKKRLLCLVLAVITMMTLFVPAAFAAQSISVTGSNNAATGKVVLKWNSVTNARKYEIYRATSKNGTYSKYSTTTKTSYTNTTATVGSTYYYKVKAINSSGTVLCTSSVVTRTCDCGQPVVTAGNDAKTGRISLKWSAISGASKYEIWRATSKTGTFTRQYTTTKTSYTNTTCVAGKTYYYKVKAICSKTSAANSVFSAVVTRTCDLARPDFKLTGVEASGKNKLTWDKIDGATGYEIWRATSKNGKYTKQYTTTSTSYTNTAGKAGYTYYYKVRAICGVSAAASAYSDMHYRTCDCAMMTNVSVDYNDAGNIIFTWDAADGATGYAIYRSDTEDGTYKLLGKPSACTFTDTTAVAGNYYYYRLVAVNSKSTAADSAPVEGPGLPLYPKPGNLRDTSTDKKTQIKWDKVKGVDGYVILRGKTDVLEEMEPLAGVVALTPWYKDDGIYHGYYYCVIGVKDMGEDEDPIPTVPAIIYIK